MPGLTRSIAAKPVLEPAAIQAAWAVPLMRPSLPDKPALLAVIDELYETRQLSNFGRYSRLFEARAQDYLQSARKFYAVSSCDTGLVLALKALGLEPGDEVLLPSFTFNSTANAVLWNGLKPVFCDIDPRTFTIDPVDARSRITPRTRAIIGVHVFGNPCDCVALERLAADRGLKLLFDAAQAFGARYLGESVSEYGDAGVYSFSGTKVVTSGEGGLAYFKDPKAAARFDRLRRYGFLGDYHTRVPGLNGKMSELHCAIAWLGILDAEAAIGHRHVAANFYRRQLRGAAFQLVDSAARSSYKDVAVLIDEPDHMAAQLAERGIETKRYFLPNHHMEAFQSFGPFHLPVTDSVHQKVLCLPVHNEISRQHLEMVATAFNEGRP